MLEFINLSLGCGTNALQIYIVDLEGKVKPRELTSGKQGMTQKPVFNAAGTKVAWLELEKDGYIFDRYD